MSKCNTTATPLETEAKLRNDTTDELINAALYKKSLDP